MEYTLDELCEEIVAPLKIISDIVKNTNEWYVLTGYPYTDYRDKLTLFCQTNPKPLKAFKDFLSYHEPYYFYNFDANDLDRSDLTYILDRVFQERKSFFEKSKKYKPDSFIN